MDVARVPARVKAKLAAVRRPGDQGVSGGLRAGNTDNTDNTDKAGYPHRESAILGSGSSWRPNVPELAARRPNDQARCDRLRFVRARTTAVPGRIKEAGN